MAIKKYAFLAIALLTSAVKADEDSCYKFYVGGDLGMGIFSINHTNGQIIDTTNDDRVASEAAYFTNSAPTFIGGGRVGLAYTGSECWYAAIEGNIHSASKTSCLVFSQDVDSSVRSINDPKVTVRDKTNFMAGFNIHLGYKVIEDGVLYAIAGYKYLKSNTSINFDFEAESTTKITYEDFYACRDLNNNGWVAGVGALMNLACNWDIRLEALYVGFGSKCWSNEFEFKSDDDTFTGYTDFKYKPKLFYGVVSLAYNF